MTALAAGPAWPERGEALCWTACLVLVLALHLIAGATLLFLRVPLVGPQAPAAAMVMIDLAPPAEPEPTPALPVAVEPPPELVLPPLEAPPPPVEMPPLEEPPPPISAPEPAVVLPPPSKPKPPKPPKPVAQAPAPPVPVQVPTPPPVAGPPAPVPPAAPPSNALPSFEGRLIAHFERHKHYPRGAQSRRQEGTPVLRFVMDRQGKVLSHRLERSSGVALLDQEVEALIERAVPLPSIPPELPADRLEFVVPFAFKLH
jgi:protein TonB